MIQLLGGNQKDSILSLKAKNTQKKWISIVTIISTFIKFDLNMKSLY